MSQIDTAIARAFSAYPDSRSQADELRRQIEDLERDLEEDGAGGWVLGDADEVLVEMRRRLAELESR